MAGHDQGTAGAMRVEQNFMMTREANSSFELSASRNALVSAREGAQDPRPHDPPSTLVTRDPGEGGAR
jgi:hypothetical protein